MELRNNVTPAVLNAATGLLQPYAPDLSPSALVKAIKAYKADGAADPNRIEKPLTRQEVAALLGCSLQTVNSHLNAGRLRRMVPRAETGRAAAGVDTLRRVGGEAAGRAAEAAEAVRRAGANGSAEAWFISGNIGMVESNYPGALACYWRALELQGEREDVLFNAALALERMNRPGEAEDLYGRIVALNPRNARAWLGLAVVRRAAGNEPAAKEALDHAASIAGPNHPQILEFKSGGK